MPTFFFTTKDKFTRLAPVIRFAMTHKLPATGQYTEGTELARGLAETVLVSTGSKCAKAEEKHRMYGVGERTRQTVLVACSTGSKRVNAEEKHQMYGVGERTCQNRVGDVLKLGRQPAAIDPYNKTS